MADSNPIETERASPRYSGIDLWTPADVLDALIEAQFAAVAATRAARSSLERAALAMEARVRYRGRHVPRVIAGVRYAPEAHPAIACPSGIPSRRRLRPSHNGAWRGPTTSRR